MRFSIFQDSDIGGRAANQDRVGYCFSRESLLLVVADGMGGHLRGEVAAELSMRVVAAVFQEAAQPTLPDPEAFFTEAFHAAHRELHHYREQHGLPECPHTTIVACVIQDNHAWWAHAGDSRLYVMRDGKPEARTRDHSKVEALFTLGLITQAQTSTHPERNKVLNCLGSQVEPAVDVQAHFPLQDGDVVVLCSDGFWSGLDDADMARILEQEPLEDAVPELVRQAVQQQGADADNTTVLAMRWEPRPDQLPSQSSLELPEGGFSTTIARLAADDI